MKLFKPAKEENELKQTPIKLVYLEFFIVQIPYNKSVKRGQETIAFNCYEVQQN